MTLLSIQYLRAVAALMVVVTHLHPQWVRMGYDGAWPFWLISGVDIFFVISGFIMWQTTQGKSISPATFYYRRAIRIIPLYWLLTSVVVIVLLVAPGLLQSTRFEGWHVVSSYLFIPSINPGNGNLEPLLIPGWTLNYEMFFYVLFGASLILPQRMRLGAVTTLLVALTLLGPTQITTGSPLAFYTSSILLEFIFGMWLSRIYIAGRLPAMAPAAWVLIIGGFTLLPAMTLVGTDLPRALTMGLPALMIVAGALALEQQGRLPDSPALLVLGNASYSLYLSHPLVLSASSQLWRAAGLHAQQGIFGGAGNWLFSLVALSFSVIVALFTFRYLERPISSGLRQLTQARTGKMPVYR